MRTVFYIFLTKFSYGDNKCMVKLYKRRDSVL